jgi:phosphoserine phosphatase
MTHVLTVIAPAGTSVLDEAFVRDLGRTLAEAGAGTSSPDWLAADEAVDLRFSGLAPRDAEGLARRQLAGLPLDLGVQALGGRRKKLLLADMESTIIEQEMIDELAEAAGIGAQVAEITRRAMTGELGFEEALTARMALLAGQPAALLDQVAERMTLHRGARTLVRTLKRDGVHCVLVSGGFSVFAERIGALCGFDAVRCNHLIVEAGRISGRVADPILGRDGKLQALRKLSRDLGIAPDAAIAVGDGANDLAMLKEAGLGVGFRPKDIVRREAPVSIEHGDLTALLYLQGYKREDFVD